MRIQTQNENSGGRIHAQISIVALTALEEELIAKFGEPLVELGGDFDGTVARPGQVNTTVALTGGGGSGATATPVIDAYGVLTGFVVTAGGTGYTSAPAVVITGDGSGAAGTAVLTSGVVTSITLTAGGRGYHVTPVTVDFSLTSKPRRLPSEFPAKQVFDLADDAKADAMAKVWLDEIETRIQTARLNLLAMENPLESDTIKNL